MKYLAVVSHCILNTCAKVRYLGERKLTEEEKNRRAFVGACAEEGIQLLQLPCPEFEMYGPRRWGHCREQFDNAFFRDRCRKMLRPVILQLKAYSEAEETRILGIVGLDGSPSCGIGRSFSANWRGELSSVPDLPRMLSEYCYKEQRGVFMEELAALLKEEGLSLPLYPLKEDTLERLKGETDEN